MADINEKVHTKDRCHENISIDWQENLIAVIMVYAEILQLCSI